MGYSITQDIIDAVRYDTRVQSAAAVVAVLIMGMMFTGGGNSLSEDPRHTSWDGAGRAMSTCQIQAQAVAPADRGVFVDQCLARQR